MPAPPRMLRVSSRGGGALAVGRGPNSVPGRGPNATWLARSARRAPPDRACLVMALALPAAPAAGAPGTSPHSSAGLPAHRLGDATLPARPVEPPGASCETVAAGGLLAGRLV